MKIVVTKNVDSFRFAFHSWKPIVSVNRAMTRVVLGKRWYLINLVFWTVTINRPERRFWYDIKD